MRWTLPRRLALPARLPALWLLPGETPAHAAACRAVGKMLMSIPSSAMMFFELASQCEGEAVGLAAQTSPRQLGHVLRRGRALDQCPQHRPTGDAKDIARHG